MKSSHTRNVPFLNVKNNVFAECVGDIVDVVFILDSSGSLGQENFEKVKEFVADVIQRVDMDSGAVRIGVEVFDTDARVVFYVSNTSLVYGSTFDFLYQIINNVGNTERVLLSILLVCGPYICVKVEQFGAVNCNCINLRIWSILQE